MLSGGAFSRCDPCAREADSVGEGVLEPVKWWRLRDVGSEGNPVDEGLHRLGSAQVLVQLEKLMLEVILSAFLTRRSSMGECRRNRAGGNES